MHIFVINKKETKCEDCNSLFVLTFDEHSMVSTHITKPNDKTLYANIYEMSQRTKPKHKERVTKQNKPNIYEQNKYKHKDRQVFSKNLSINKI